MIKQLGLKPTRSSGSTWLEKADGQNEYIICELKSTEKQSILVKEADLVKLEAQSAICHKLPIFAIQFINNNNIYIMVKPEDISEVARYINTGKCEKPNCIDISEHKEVIRESKPKIKSDKKQREKFWKQKEEEYKNGRTKAY